MNTLFLLMAEYNAAPIVPLEEIREKYFGIATKLEANRRANNHALPVPAFKLGGQRSGF